MIPFDRLCTITQSLNVASVANATSAEQDFTVPGLQVGDVIFALSKPTASAGLGIVNTRVKSANTMSVTFMNTTASPIDPAAETYTISVLRPEKTLATLQFVSM